MIKERVCLALIPEWDRSTVALTDIRQMLEVVREPTRSILTLMVFASMRPGEVLALRWKDILRDRIVVDERVYDDEFDDVKTDAGERRMESRLTKSTNRDVAIGGENSQRSIIPVSSDLSRFSRGTGSGIWGQNALTVESV